MNARSAGPFHYKELDDKSSMIRLLQLLPGKRGSTVSCHLQQSSVASRTKYYCLSYQWGGADESAPLIDINGKYFQIQQNLWNFLDVARSKYTWQ